MKTPTAKGAEVVAFGEHHASTDAQGKRILKFCRGVRRRISISRARAADTENSQDKLGGAMLSVNASLSFGMLKNEKGVAYVKHATPKPAYSAFVVGDDWSACRILLKGVSVIVVSAYLTDTIGVAGINLQKLMQIALI